ncbi:hypothetical protein CRG98_017556, partial [Punica granatum]
GRELFLSDSSVFVDDVEAYEKYLREEEFHKNMGDGSSSGEGPSAPATDAGDSEGPLEEDGDDLDINELNELEESLSKSVKINESGTNS